MDVPHCDTEKKTLQSMPDEMAYKSFDVPSVSNCELMKLQHIQHTKKIKMRQRALIYKIYMLIYRSVQELQGVRSE